MSQAGPWNPNQSEIRTQGGLLRAEGKARKDAHSAAPHNLATI